MTLDERVVAAVLLSLFALAAAFWISIDVADAGERACVDRGAEYVCTTGYRTEDGASVRISSCHCEGEKP